MAVVAGLAFVAVGHDAVFHGENRVVFAHVGIPPRENFGAALPHDDISRARRLAPVQFYAEKLGVALG